jgi:hypothetical protein
MELKKGVYTASLDSKKLKDGAYVIVVNATNSKYTTSATTEILVRNGSAMKSIVTKSGSQFSLDGKSFYYNGWNTYDLSYKDTLTKASNDKAIIYAADGKKIELFIKKGTVVTYQEQIDRQMLEAKKLGVTVLRTWGFHTVAGDPHSFYNVDWTFNENQFKEFDYLMDSAKKHGIRLPATRQERTKAGETTR